MHVGFHSSLLTSFAHNRIDFLPRLGDNLFDASGMDTSIENELRQSETGHFSPYRIEAGENHRFWRVIDDEVYPGGGFQRANVATLPRPKPPPGQPPPSLTPPNPAFSPASNNGKPHRLTPATSLI